MRAKTVQSDGMTLLDQDEGYRAAHDKLLGLQLDRNAKDVEISRHLSLPRRVLKDERAQALLDGVQSVAVAGADTEDATLARLRDELSVLDRAIVLQGAIVDRERTRASREIAATFRDEHCALVRIVAGAAAAIAHANARERKMRHRLEDGGILYQAGGITPFTFLDLRIGRLDDDTSMVVAFLRAVCEGGYLSQAEVDRMRADV